MGRCRAGYAAGSSWSGAARHAADHRGRDRSVDLLSATRTGAGCGLRFLASCELDLVKRSASLPQTIADSSNAWRSSSMTPAGAKLGPADRQRRATWSCAAPPLQHGAIT